MNFARLERVSVLDYFTLIISDYKFRQINKKANLAVQLPVSMQELHKNVWIHPFVSALPFPSYVLC